MPGAGVRTNITPRMGSKVETLWQAAFTTDLNARHIMKQNRFLIRFTFLPPPPPLRTPKASSSAPLLQSAEPFTALELLQLLEQRFRSDQARRRRLETSSWEVPRLPEPEPPAAGSAPATGRGGGSPGWTGLRPGGLQTPRG